MATFYLVTACWLLGTQPCLEHKAVAMPDGFACVEEMQKRKPGQWLCSPEMPVDTWSAFTCTKWPAGENC